MTKLKDFKLQNSNIDWNVIDVLTDVDISKTNKFLPLFINLINENRNHFDSHSRIISEDSEYMMSKFGESSGHNSYVCNLKYSLVNHLFDGWHNIQLIEKFMNYHQKNAFTNVDITKITSISEIANLVGLREIKTDEKKFSKMVIKHYETDDWLLVRPLTWSASKKYGAGSKWCTTQSHNYRYFYDYSENAALIYCINLKTGYKVAFHEPIDNHNSNKRHFAFWSAEDDKVDSMNTELPIEIIYFLKEMELKSNKELSNGIWEKCYYLDSSFEKDVMVGELISIEQPIRIEQPEAFGGIPA